MRIICDHCERPISGTVKVLAGSFNLHPDCMTELGRERKPKPAASWQSPESTLIAFVEAPRAQAS
jgi:hypothetical protein